MRDLAAALALALVIEGLAWAAFPEGMRRMVAGLLSLPAETLRMVGLFAAILGLLGVWLARSAIMPP